MSYNGKVGFGLLADYDSMEDVERRRRRASTTSLAELEAGGDRGRGRRLSRRTAAAC